MRIKTEFFWNKNIKKSKFSEKFIENVAYDQWHCRKQLEQRRKLETLTSSLVLNEHNSILAKPDLLCEIFTKCNSIEWSLSNL